MDNLAPDEYQPLPGQAYDPVSGWQKNRKVYQPGQLPRCQCGKPRHLSTSGLLAATCLGLECLHDFLRTKRRKSGKGTVVPPATPSEAIKADLLRLLARKEV